MNQSTLSEKKVHLSPLAEVLAYEKPQIVYKFLETWDIPEAEAFELFEELKKWLWLSAGSIIRKSEGDVAPQLAITYSMTLLDEMWHTFILFSTDYTLFCKHYFGFYINHAPTTKKEKDASLKEFKADSDAFRSKIEAETALQYSYIFDHLGEETLVKWYSEWTDKVTSEFLNKTRKPFL